MLSSTTLIYFIITPHVLCSKQHPLPPEIILFASWFLCWLSPKKICIVMEHRILSAALEEISYLMNKR